LDVDCCCGDGGACGLMIDWIGTSVHSQPDSMCCSAFQVAAASIAWLIAMVALYVVGVGSGYVTTCA
jgi:hypothetical protein